MSRVFISHSSEDCPFVEREILPLLKKNGIDTFYSPLDIRAADQWERRLRTGLQQCDWFLVVMSPRSAASPWVTREVSWAMEKRRGRLIPVLMQECADGTWHVGFSELQYIDFRKNKRVAKTQLISLFGLNGKGPVAAAEQQDDDGHPVRRGGRCGGDVLAATAAADIELVIDRNFDSYTPEEQERLLEAIRNLLTVSEKLQVVSKRRGSVKLRLRLTPEQAEQLLWAAKGGKLAEFGVVDATRIERDKLGDVEAMPPAATPSAEEMAGTRELSFDDVLARLRGSQNDAETQRFNRFARRLMALAGRQLNRPVLRKIDPEDVEQSVFRSIFTHNPSGRFEKFQSWDNLWGTLVLLAWWRCNRPMDCSRAAPRDVPADTGSGEESPSGVGVRDDEPTPAEAALLTEMIEHLMRGLSERERAVLTLELQGYTLAEISSRLGCAERTVNRVLERVKGLLKAMRNEPGE
jgi:DNA-directed RNA polymerase specialized sigma24 family protein